MTKETKRDFLFLTGAVLIIAGFLKFSIAVGVIVAGVCCVAVALAPTRGN
jgi:hypothetical protein